LQGNAERTSKDRNKWVRRLGQTLCQLDLVIKSFARAIIGWQGKGFPIPFEPPEILPLDGLWFAAGMISCPGSRYLIVKVG
jgi:hypothetical protein